MRRPVLSSLAALLVVAVIGIAWWALEGGEGGAPPDGGARAPGTTRPPDEGASLPRASGPSAPSTLTVDGAAGPEPASGPAAAAPAPPPVDAPPATVRGRVTDPDGRPLAAVRVTYAPPARQADRWPRAGTPDVALDDLPSVVTRGDGRFALDTGWRGAPAGDRWNTAPDLVLDADGFAVRALPCVGLSAAGLDLGDVVLEPGGTLSGRVLDADGRPLSGVTVRVFARAPEPRHVRPPYRGALESFLRVVTGPDGRFTSRGLWPGTVGFSITMPGAVPVWESGLGMEPGLALDVGDVVLERGATLSGVVVDASGTGVAGARVHALDRDLETAFIGFDPGDSVPWELREARDDDGAAHGVTADDGSFALSGLTGGSLAVYAEADGYEPGKAAGLAPDERAVTVVLEPAARLLVRVTDAATGEDLPDAALEAVRVAFFEQPALAVTRRGDGVFVASGAGPDENRVEARAPGRGTVARTVPGVAPGEALDVVVPLHAAAVVRGTFVDAAGAPRAGVAVSLEPVGTAVGPGDGAPAGGADGAGVDAHPAGVAASTTSGADGAFRVDALAPGRWRLSTSVAGAAPLAAPDGGPVTLDVAAGEVRDLGDVRLRAGAVVAGRVVDASGAAQEGVAVRLVRTAREPAPAGGATAPAGASTAADVPVERESRADGSGAFTFRDLPPGAYTLTSVREASATTAVLRPGDVAEVVLVARAAPRVLGTVTVGGAPVEGARVFVREDDDRSIWGAMIAERTDHTDVRGAYALTLPAAGPHRLSVTTPAGSRTSLPLAFAWDREERVDVAFGTGGLAGVVRAAPPGDGPVAEARVAARRVDGGPGGPDTTGAARADADGAFLVPELWPGRWTLTVRAPGFAPREAGPFDVRADEVTGDLVVTLEPGASLAGLVRRPDVEVVPDDMDVQLRRVDDDERVARTGTEGGRYAFDDLPSGTFRLLVSEPGEGGDLGVEVFLHEETVVLAAGERRTLDVDLPRP